MKKILHFVYIFLFTISLFYTNISYAGAQIAWTENNCYRVKGVSDGSDTYIKGRFGSYTFYYAKPKFFYGGNRWGCEIYLKTPQGVAYCSSRSLHDWDGRRAYSHVNRCAYR